MHVATVRKRQGDKVYETHLLRRTFREEGKVKHETLGNISHLPPQVIEMIRGALKGEAFLPASSHLEIARTLPHGHVAATLGSLRKIGLETVIASRSSRERDLVVAMVVSRVIEPASKLATSRSFDPRCASSTLPKALDLGRVDEDDLYRAMDWLAERQGRIEGKLAKKHLRDGSLILYDVTSSYYTGTSCPLARFGHNRDKKKGFPQILYGLLCDGKGCPVAVEVFEGNTADPMTLSSQIKKIRRRFGLERVILVGDRGMITEARIREELRPVEGLEWITALKANEIKRLAEEGAIQPSLFDERDLAEITSPDYPGERLIACRNPFLAEDRARTREELLAATEKKLDEIVMATQREKRPLRGKAEIALRVGKVIDRYKVGKHFKLIITEEGFSFERDTGRIADEASRDGIYIIRTSVPERELGSEEVVSSYKSLSAVERAFRCLKSVDLKVRPIGHRKPERVRAHIFICMLAYYVEWHMRRELAPLLFDDEDWELARAMRESVVSPAVRSQKAQAKARKKRTEDGLPVHSFHTLIADLRTLALNRVRSLARSGEMEAMEFDLLTTPTPLQSKAFELLGVPLSL